MGSQTTPGFWPFEPGAEASHICATGNAHVRALSRRGRRGLGACCLCDTDRSADEGEFDRTMFHELSLFVAQIAPRPKVTICQVPLLRFKDAEGVVWPTFIFGTKALSVVQLRQRGCGNFHGLPEARQICLPSFKIQICILNAEGVEISTGAGCFN